MPAVKHMKEQLLRFERIKNTPVAKNTAILLEKSIYIHNTHYKTRVWRCSCGEVAQREPSVPLCIFKDHQGGFVPFYFLKQPDVDEWKEFIDYNVQKKILPFKRFTAAFFFAVIDFNSVTIRFRSLLAQISMFINCVCLIGCSVYDRKSDGCLVHGILETYFPIWTRRRDLSS